MKGKSKDFKDCVKQGRPLFGDTPRRGISLSLDADVIAFLGDTGRSSKANDILAAAMDKENFDSQG